MNNLLQSKLDSEYSNEDSLSEENEESNAIDNNLKVKSDKNIFDKENEDTNNNDLEESLEEDKMIKAKLSNAKVDSAIKSACKSAVFLKTKSHIQLDEDTFKTEEEIRFNLPDDSPYILDESELFYRRKTEKEITNTLESFDKESNSKENKAPVRYKTHNAVSKLTTDNNNSKDEDNDKMKSKFETKKDENKRLKFSCMKVILEYPDAEPNVPDYNELKFNKKLKLNNKGKKSKSKTPKKKKVEIESSDEELDCLSEKELERLKEVRKKREESKQAKEIEQDEKNRKNKEIESDNSQSTGGDSKNKKSNKKNSKKKSAK